MQADPQEHEGLSSRRDRFPLVELVLALALIAGLAYFWFSTEDEKAGQSVVEVPAIAESTSQAGLPSTPDIPQRQETVTERESENATAIADSTTESNETALAEPLTPMDGDSLLRQQLAATGTDTILNKLPGNEHPLDISAALIDGLGRGVILRKILPADPPKQAFSVEKEDGDVYMNAASYQRYDAYTDTLTALDTSQLVETFHTLRPLYEQAFENLGLDAGDFDNAVIRTLDLVLATPEITDPIALKPKSVVYTYADPALEGLPAVQKQLLRMGPDNIRRIKQQARILREGLLAQ